MTFTAKEESRGRTALSAGRRRIDWAATDTFTSGQQTTTLSRIISVLIHELVQAPAIPIEDVRAIAEWYVFSGHLFLNMEISNSYLIQDNMSY